MLQQMKIKSSALNNRVIFLERCTKKNITPASISLKPSMISSKGLNIMKECSRNLIRPAKNDAKQ